ncbi:MAG: acyltransferase family protein, partial [Actinomycetota bacterium]
VGATSGLWLATWVLQVMPLFFFVGGFSNLKSYEAMRARGLGYRDFMRARVSRLLAPTAVFIGAWIPVQVSLHLLDLGGEGLVRLSMLPFGPLWFLLVYMSMIALTPAMLRLHRVHGVRVVVVLVGLALLADAARFGSGIPYVGLLNLATVWLNAHQLGFFYADGSLERAGRRAHVAMALAGLAALVVLTNVGVYPRSMVGTDIERASNMNPPTLCIVALTFWQLGLAMTLRERAGKWLQRSRPWMGVIAINGMIMTVYLWHLTAYLVTIQLLYPLGLGHPTDSTGSWWLQRPLWLVAPALVLAGFVAVFGRFERPSNRARRTEASEGPS